MSSTRPLALTLVLWPTFPTAIDDDPAMSKLSEVLAQVNFGSRVAEDETKELGRYFVETAQWSRISSGEKDVVYGPKGAGKSALYAVLVERGEDFSQQDIIVVSAEQSQGAPLFAEVVTDPPRTEQEWRMLWRAYFIGIVADVLESFAIETDAAKEVFEGLEKNGLRQGKGLKALLRSAREFAHRLGGAKNLEAEAGVDPATGAMRLGAKLQLDDAERGDLEAAIAVASLLEAADKALSEAGKEVWIALDRLDAAFMDPAIESPAIRALMRVYRDLAGFEQIALKIFLRQDIWTAIVDNDVFREGSHIVRDESINWNRDTLLNLAIRRMLRNEALCEHFGVDPNVVLAGVEEQERLFERLFQKVDPNENMLDWALESIRDGHRRSAPRELIHLLGELRDKQLERLQVGRPDPPDGAFFDLDVRALALEAVSRTHLEKTLYSEIRKIKEYVEVLRGGRVRYTEEELKRLWEGSVDSVEGLIKTLLDAGFLRRLPPPEGGFEVAMLYRPALELFEDEQDQGADGG